MQKFDRGNEIVLSGTFTPVTGTAVPSSAEAVLLYPDPNGDPETSTISMVDDGNGVWMGRWDSSLCGGGVVEWVMRSEGPVKAATQGKFLIVANAANVAAYD